MGIASQPITEFTAEKIQVLLAIDSKWESMIADDRAKAAKKKA